MSRPMAFAAPARDTCGSAAVFNNNEDRRGGPALKLGLQLSGMARTISVGSRSWANPSR